MEWGTSEDLPPPSPCRRRIGSGLDTGLYQLVPDVQVEISFKKFVSGPALLPAFVPIPVPCIGVFIFVCFLEKQHIFFIN
jgi:hypothetical protein